MGDYRVIGTDGREYGPITQEQIRTWIGEGRVNASSLVCAEGSRDWRSLAALPEFRPFVAPAPLREAVTLPVPPGVRQTNKWAIWGFVCGLLSLTLCSCCCLPLDLLGIVFSVIGLVQISSHPETQAGTTLAILGLVLSVLSFLMGFAFTALWFSTGAAEEFRRELQRELNAGVARIVQILAGTPSTN